MHIERGYCKTLDRQPAKDEEDCVKFELIIQSYTNLAIVGTHETKDVTVNATAVDFESITIATGLVCKYSSMCNNDWKSDIINKYYILFIFL